MIYSFQFKVNSICVWQYNRYTDYGSALKDTEEVDIGIPTPLTDSSDEPRLVCSAIHVGSVHQLKVSNLPLGL